MITANKRTALLDERQKEQMFELIRNGHFRKDLEKPEMLREGPAPGRCGISISTF